MGTGGPIIGPKPIRVQNHRDLNHFGHKSLERAGFDYMVNVNSLNATPPKPIAKAISKTVIDSAFFNKTNHNYSFLAHVSPYSPKLY
jgi:hypothetical protein